jgi:hypothetical protein
MMRRQHRVRRLNLDTVQVSLGMESNLREHYKHTSQEKPCFFTRVRDCDVSPRGTEDADRSIGCPARNRKRMGS